MNKVLVIPKGIGVIATVSTGPYAQAQGKIIAVHRDGTVTIDPNLKNTGTIRGKPN